MNAERQAVEFEVEIGECQGAVRVPRRVFQPLLPERPTPERCLEAYYLQRTRFESIAERNLADASYPRMGTWRSGEGLAGGVRLAAPRKTGDCDADGIGSHTDLTKCAAY